MFLKEFNKMSKIVFIFATVSFKEFSYDIIALTTNVNMMTTEKDNESTDAKFSVPWSFIIFLFSKSQNLSKLLNHLLLHIKWWQVFSVYTLMFLSSFWLFLVSLSLSAISQFFKSFSVSLTLTACFCFNSVLLWSYGKNKSDDTN